MIDISSSPAIQGLSTVFQFLEVLIVPIMVYFNKKLDDIKEDKSAIKSDVRELRNVLIGIDGKNGMRSRLQRVERRIERLSSRQAIRHSEPPNDTDLEEDEEDDDDF